MLGSALLPCCLVGTFFALVALFDLPVLFAGKSTKQTIQFNSTADSDHLIMYVESMLRIGFCSLRIDIEMFCMSCRVLHITHDFELIDFDVLRIEVCTLCTI